jgi:hypothetical protein
MKTSNSPLAGVICNAMLPGVVRPVCPQTMCFIYLWEAK